MADSVKIIERGFGFGWHVKYKGFNVVKQDKEEALQSLAQDLMEHNIELPEELKRFKDSIGVQKH
jgi:hypothetical protein